MVLGEALNQIDAQLYFNFFILTGGEVSSPTMTLSNSASQSNNAHGPYKMFHRSEQATRRTIEKAREWLASETFARQFGDAKATRHPLAQTLKPVRACLFVCLFLFVLA
jgi:hypothetical protein